ncbi:MAG: hypothetical protein ACE5I1_17955 [bacterium]
MELHIGKWLMALGAGVVVTIGFDAIMHGLSHGGHGILDSLWKDEKLQRSSSTILFGNIMWHVLADFLLGFVLSLLIAISQQKTLSAWIISGILLGFLMAIAWIHLYAAFEINGKTASILGLLSVLQATLASVVIGWVYSRGPGGY